VHAGRAPRRSNLSGVKLLGRNRAKGGAQEAEPTVAQAPAVPPSTTAPKGRPTPKRSETSKRRGPVAPAPMTTSEARKRRKEMRRTLTKEEQKADKLERRARMNDRRAKMMAGEEAYLLPRDQGPVRRYARDIVDSRRNVLGLFMPAALGLIFVMLAVPKVQLFISPAMLLLMAVMAIDGILLARKVNTAVDAKYPDNTESSWKLGLYAAGRASQMRRMRAPRPQVERGAKVT
jgi:Protein of unknown function (DUF3043)